MELARLATAPYPCVYTRCVFCHVRLLGMPAWLTSRGESITTRSVGDPPAFATE